MCSRTVIRVITKIANEAQYLGLISMQVSIDDTVKAVCYLLVPDHLAPGSAEMLLRLQQPIWRLGFSEDLIKLSAEHE
ncbi:uncharacterized protein PHALS_10003 [Plasmopara halstedii]|uniref:Uncharacterized protein n=1 Tax=Plasmopara halstedii TaxID=4781 RepID=A0A0P1AGK3_PLAHL|nr:uncharacterized protein PHALS_10003 [Plasmopara halstedii]CEG39767.1 hypothetical protein PHALS_10003 [Plasmopara halstedii]|eukprot:XP_024576136.1 hypothetical protein PHALS_10003 [Plasmopara halstedii]